MRFLEAERATLERMMPGLDEELAAHTLAALEKPGNPGLKAFRAAKGPGLLIPAEHGGQGATAQQALRCTRAIGSRSPSLGVAATMHNFSVASLVALCERSTGMEWMLLDAIARDRLLVASAFAEGRSGQGVLSPTMRAERRGDRWRVSGSKKPCSMAVSADIITASVSLTDGDEDRGVGVALIPRHSKGISVRPFWNSTVLTGAESDELILDDVVVDDQLMVPLEPDSPVEEPDIQTIGLIWFTVLISGVYIGATSALVDRLITTGRATPHLRAQVVTEIEGAMLALERAAADLDEGRDDSLALSHALIARYTTQNAIRGVVAQTVELLGGMGFIGDPDVGYLASACQALAFHPPSRGSVGECLDDFFSGAPSLRIG